MCPALPDVLISGSSALGSIDDPPLLHDLYEHVIRPTFDWVINVDVDEFIAPRRTPMSTIRQELDGGDWSEACQLRVSFGRFDRYSKMLRLLRGPSKERFRRGIRTVRLRYYLRSETVLW